MVPTNDVETKFETIEVDNTICGPSGPNKWSWDKIWNYWSNKWSLWAQWSQQMKLRQNLKVLKYKAYSNKGTINYTATLYESYTFVATTIIWAGSMQKKKNILNFKYFSTTRLIRFFWTKRTHCTFSHLGLAFLCIFTGNRTSTNGQASDRSTTVHY